MKPIDLALTLDQTKRNIVVSPRDVASRDWLERPGSLMALMDPLESLHEKYSGSGVTRRELPIMAAELESLANARVQAHLAGRDRASIFDGIAFRVRAYEYVTVAKEEELVEIR
ncbi:MAG: hypothetical protein WBY94_03160 [Polyangiaceae bacterium]